MEEKEQEEVLPARLIYEADGRDSGLYNVFREKNFLLVNMSVYPLDSTMCNEFTLRQHQRLKYSDTSNVSLIEAAECFLYFPIYLRGDGGEIVGVVKWTPPPRLDVEKGLLVFDSRTCPFVYLLPGAPLFPQFDDLHSLILDSRLSLHIVV